VDGRVSALLVAKFAMYRVPFLTERVLPFAMLVGAMACYLNLSRRHELVVARSAGVSAWQFIAPAVVIAMLIGIAASTLYNPVAVQLRESSVRLEPELFLRGRIEDAAGGHWIRQRSDDGQAIINAASSSQRGQRLAGVSIFRFDDQGHFRDRIEAKSALLEPGYWQLEDARIYAIGAPPDDRNQHRVSTSVTAAQLQESFVPPETVSFWQLGSQITLAEDAGLSGAGYRLQYYQLLMQPLYFAAMVMLAAAVSLRFFRFGGVQRMVLAGLCGGFFLFVFAKFTGDLSQANMMPPLAAAIMPALIAGVIGSMTLLHLEDG
jgi:lipopolysaccharide export system permease protein